MSCTGHWSLSAWPSMNIIIILQQQCCWQNNHQISPIRLSCSLLTFKSVINCALVMMLHLNVHLEYLRLCRSGSFTLELKAGVSQASSIDMCLMAIVAYVFKISFRNMLHTNFWRGVLGTSPCWSVQCCRVFFYYRQLVTTCVLLFWLVMNYHNKYCYADMRFVSGKEIGVALLWIWRRWIDPVPCNIK